MGTDLVTVADTSVLTGRRWLALRFLAISVLTNCAMWWVMQAVDPDDHLFRQIPRWAQIVAVLPAVAASLGLAYLLFRGSHDLLIHALPAGPWKTRLVGDESSVSASAEEFPELGWTAAYAPLLVLACYLALVLIAVLVLGGLAGVYALFSGARALTAGWPSWAIVIIALLILILFKQDRRQG